MHDRIRLHHQGADLPRLTEHRGQLGVVLQDVPFKQTRTTPEKAQALADYGTKFRGGDRGFAVIGHGGRR